MSDTPDLRWYTGISQDKGLLPRCPFTSVRRCPRYYASLSLLGDAGSTKIERGEDMKLLKEWRRSDLWPVVMEQEPQVSGPGDEMKHFTNFCPEISFERFGWFASGLYRYSDEIDIDLAHRQLARQGVGHKHWRWAWSSVVPMHYSECPVQINKNWKYLT